MPRIGRSLSSGKPVPALPTGPTTKECNSRVRKHFGSRFSRCYNRVNDTNFVHPSGFPVTTATACAAHSGEACLPGEHRNKEDHLVRIIE